MLRETLFSYVDVRVAFLRHKALSRTVTDSIITILFFVEKVKLVNFSPTHL